MPSRSDRTVHARYEGMEIVRYDRSGKWYFEPTHSALDRQHIGIDDAVRNAVWGLDQANGVIYHGLPGGSAFDRKVRAARERRFS